MAFDAYANDADQLSIDGDAMTVTNGTTRIVIAGELNLTRDQRGLKAALALKQALDSAIATLQSDKALPAHAKEAPDEKPGRVDNPFQ